jgi:hypothetical protein
VRILLDECVPRRLARDLVGHEVRTSPAMGWASKRNGELLRLAEGHFDLFVTVDRNLSFQQDVGKFELGVVVLVAASNRYADLQPLLAGLLAKLNDVAPGQVLHIGA